MKLTATLINTFASLLVAGGILMRIYNLPDEQVSLTISLFGVLIYILASPEQLRLYRRKMQQEKFQ